jgi:hypothetical protein
MVRPVGMTAPVHDVSGAAWAGIAKIPQEAKREKTTRHLVAKGWDFMTKPRLSCFLLT